MNSIGRAKSDSGMKSYLFRAKHNWTGFFLAFAGITALMAANDRQVLQKLETNSSQSRARLTNQ